MATEITSVENLIQIVPTILYQGHVVLNVFNFETQDADIVPNPTYEALKNAWISACLGPWRSMSPSNARIVNLTLQELTFDVTIPRHYRVVGAFSESITGPTGGLRDPAEYPAAVSAVVTLQTGIPGRRRRGRVYLAPISPDSVDDGIVKDDFIDAADDYMLPMANGFDIGTVANPQLWQLTVWSRADTAAAVGPVPLRNTATVVQNMRYNRQLRSQRRRNVGIGI